MSLSISAAEYNAIQAGTMSEQKLQDAITGAAQRLGWLVYHTHDSRRSQAGYPDLHLVHEKRQLSILRELKTQKGSCSPAQLDWIRALTAAGVDIAVWRPIHWFDGTITAVLFPPEAR
ncbi:MAG: VRR-NUC domain-containing protein [Pseudolysinimonas sp.]